jgi:uncharacterized tellurite resistance protein B-like protein
MLKHIKNFFDQHLVPGSVTGDADTEHMLRLAIGALLLEMTHMDGEVWPEQREAVETAVFEHLDLAEDETEELLELAEEERSESTDYFQFTSLINNHYTPEQKVRLVELLWRIAYANEDLHIHEEHLVRKIADLLHVPHSAFIAAKLNARP